MDVQRTFAILLRTASPSDANLDRDAIDMWLRDSWDVHASITRYNIWTPAMPLAGAPPGTAAAVVCCVLVQCDNNDDVPALLNISRYSVRSVSMDMVMAFARWTLRNLPETATEDSLLALARIAVNNHTTITPKTRGVVRCNRLDAHTAELWMTWAASRRFAAESQDGGFVVRARAVQCEGPAVVPPAPLLDLLCTIEDAIAATPLEPATAPVPPPPPQRSGFQLDAGAAAAALGQPVFAMLSNGTRLPHQSVVCDAICAKLGCTPYSILRIQEDDALCVATVTLRSADAKAALLALRFIDVGNAKISFTDGICPQPVYMHIVGKGACCLSCADIEVQLRAYYSTAVSHVAQFGTQLVAAYFLTQEAAGSFLSRGEFHLGAGGAGGTARLYGPVVVIDEVPEGITVEHVAEQLHGNIRNSGVTIAQFRDQLFEQSEDGRMLLLSRDTDIVGRVLALAQLTLGGRKCMMAKQCVHKFLIQQTPYTTLEELRAHLKSIIKSFLILRRRSDNTCVVWLASGSEKRELCAQSPARSEFRILPYTRPAAAAPSTPSQQHQLAAAAADKTLGPVWVVMLDNGPAAYPVSVASALEEAFAKGTGLHVVTIGGGRQVDLDLLRHVYKQVMTNDPFRVRRVERVFLPVGMQLPTLSVTTDLASSSSSSSSSSSAAAAVAPTPPVAVAAAPAPFDGASNKKQKKKCAEKTVSVSSAAATAATSEYPNKTRIVPAAEGED